MAWVPTEAIRYLTHTELGCSIRAIARAAGCHASTISRQVRRFENRRDDPLVDTALDRLGEQSFAAMARASSKEDDTKMTARPDCDFKTSEGVEMSRHTLRVLRRLAETGAVLAVAAEMEKAVVVRDLPGGKSTRTAVVAREVAEVMALNEWISCDNPGRIARYRITGVGRAALKRMMAESGPGLAEAAQPFAEQHRDWAERDEVSDGRSRKVKYNVAESPLTSLARRRDKDGNAFLSDELVAAGERLREDFELAQMGPNVTQNWDRFLTAGAGGGLRPDSGIAEGPRAARERVSAALGDLGPGLGDVALRCCCYLEGIETTERKMGWSARSGKIVLRIALQRLRVHYEQTGGKFAPLIG
jgi:transposase-like protein